MCTENCSLAGSGTCRKTNIQGRRDQETKLKILGWSTRREWVKDDHQHNGASDVVIQKKLIRLNTKNCARMLDVKLQNNNDPRIS